VSCGYAGVQGIAATACDTRQPGGRQLGWRAARPAVTFPTRKTTARMQIYSTTISVTATPTIQREYAQRVLSTGSSLNSTGPVSA